MYRRPFGLLTLSFRKLLVLLLAVDLALILVNVIAVLAADASLIDHVPEWLKVTADLEPPEDFNYLKWLVIAVALFWLALRDRWLAPALWAGVFIMLLADDAMQLHETLGNRLSRLMEIPDNSYVYGTDFGEMMVFGIMGGITLAIALFLLTRKDAATGQMNLRYAGIVVALGFFGVGIDALHSIVVHLTGASGIATAFQQLFGMIEDGGEMLVGSLAVALTLAPPGARQAAP